MLNLYWCGVRNSILLNIKLFGSKPVVYGGVNATCESTCVDKMNITVDNTQLKEIVIKYKKYLSIWEESVMDQKIDFFHQYNADEIGAVFKFEGEIYREIYPEYVEQTMELFDCGLVKKLVDKQLLIDTQITDMHLQKGDLVLKHETIPIITHEYEWTYGMIKDAALLIIELLRELDLYGYELKDCHDGNVAFRNNKPIFIDFGSIILNSHKRYPLCYRQFLNAYYCPLLLANTKYDTMIRSLMKSGTLYSNMELVFELSHIKISKFIEKLYSIEWKLLYKDYNGGLTKWKVASQIGFILKWFGIISKQKIDRKRCAWINKYEKKLKNIKCYRNKTQWGDYYTADSTFENTRFGTLIKQVKIHDDEINSVWEIGANSGWFAEELLKKCNISTYVATDYDMKAVEKCYNRFGNKNVYVANVDVKEVYIGYCDGETEIERFCSDLVIALALTHHLILTQKLNIKWIAKFLYDSTNAYVLTEFMPLGLWYGQETDMNTPNWYTYEWFKNEMELYFDFVWEQKTETNRISILLRKKKNVE